MNSLLKVIILLLIIGLFSSAEASNKSGVDVKTTATRYLKAAQTRDFRTFLPMSEDYVTEITNLKQSVPSFQYDRRSKEVTQKYLELFETSSLAVLLPKSCNWKILDIKPWQGGGNWYQIFIGIEYHDKSEAPKFDTKIIKSTVSSLVINNKSGLIVGTFNEYAQAKWLSKSIMAEENTYWQTPITVTDLVAKLAFGSGSRPSCSGICRAFVLNFNIEGGVPPFNYTINVNGVPIKKVFQEANYEHINVYPVNNVLEYAVLIDSNTKFPSSIKVPAKVQLVVKDSTNQQAIGECIFDEKY